MSVQYQRRYFNVTEYYRMAEAGVLTENDHVELIEGEIGFAPKVAFEPKV